MYNYSNVYQPYQMMPQQPQRAPQSNMEWIMVQTVNQVESVAVQPCMKAWIMVQNEPIFALRTADQMGLITTEYYHFEKYEPNAQASSYVTADQLQNAINSLRGELYESISETASNRGTKPAKAKSFDAE